MDVRKPAPARHSSARCARCGTAFDCGSMTRPLDCWCASMPALPVAATSGKASRAGKCGCLCPACYADELAAAGEAGKASRSAHPGAARQNSTD